MSRRRAGALLLLLLGVAGCRTQPPPGVHVVDTAQVLDPAAVARMDRLYEGLRREADVDLVVVSIPALNPGEAMNARANQIFDDWSLGRRTRANRGLLLLVSVQDKLVRLHTSYELESLLTDAFISQVENGVMTPYFQRGMPGPGLEATAEFVAHRVYERILNKTYDPNAVGDADIGGFHAGGGGAEKPVPLGGSVPSGSTAAVAVDDRIAYAAQPTPAQAWEAFLAFNRHHVKDASVGLFDDKTEVLFQTFPTPDMSQDSLVRRYEGKPYEVREERDLAAIVFLDDPDGVLAPWFFKRGPNGWQLNGTMYPGMIKYDHMNRWGFGTADHPYHFAFKDFDIRPGHLGRRKPNDAR